MKRRTYTEPRLQLLYDELRAKRPDPAKVRGAGGIGNAYAVGYGVNMSQFWRRLEVIREEHRRAAALSEFYPKR
ncbi:hypothetical protein HX878_20595 [Pseudomonas veronii]|uniref:hypothetical protein n=1 Tax=Pseudomonas veronii TaxID=76761 RepID=UPI0015A20429|nr:hypothetical protein [Pseudomonas veronii]NWD57133.1 hypothetical protein [Pseudomonas veronii]